MYKIADVDNASMVSPNISDDKHHLTLNTDELLPNMYDNQQCVLAT